MAAGRGAGARLVGVISDTHGLLRDEALAALAGVDLIVHAGDIGEPAILEALAAIAPVTAVRGNNDHGAWAEALPERAELVVGGARLLVIHDVNELASRGAPAELGRFAAVIAGHSHRPRNEVIDGVLRFNPGAAGPRRFRLPVSVGVISVAGGGVHGRVIELQIAPAARGSQTRRR
jgi:putative phosphoesterase